MGRRITLYEAALAGAEATGGASARQAAIAAFEKADSVFRLIHRIREYGAPTFGFVGLLVVVAILLGWGFDGFTRDYWEVGPPSTAMVRSAYLFGLALACYSVWDIALLFEKFGLVPGRLKVPTLAPFHLLRERCADAVTAAFEHDGKVIDGPIFKSFWSLILFSQYPAHRRFRLPNANGIFEGQPLIDAPVSGEVILIDQGVEPAREAPVINAVINYSETTNTLNIQNTIQVAPGAKRRNTKPEKPHWYSGVSAEVHAERSGKIANHWTGGQVAQVQTALDTAFAETRDGQRPGITVVELVAEIAKALLAANMSVGLNNTESSVWISMMFSDGKSPYEWVRRFLTEPDFEPMPGLPFSN
jgi:hypothetical protein